MAKSMKNKMIKFKTAFTAVTWSEILSQINSVSKYLQKPGIDQFTAVNLLKGLKTYVSSLREKFLYFENKEQILHSKCDYEELYCWYYIIQRVIIK